MTVTRDHVKMVETTKHAIIFVTKIIIDMASVNYTTHVVVILKVNNYMFLK